MRRDFLVRHEADIAVFWAFPNGVLFRNKRTVDSDPGLL